MSPNTEIEQAKSGTVSRRVCLAALLSALAFSASAVPVNPHWSVRDWQLNDGLPNNAVTGVAQTPDGYLWIGTRSGLVRFDGVRFEEFAATNFISWPAQGQRALLGSRHGGLWMAMDPSVVVFLNSGAAEVCTNNVPTRFPTAWAEDGEGAFWIAYGDAVFRVKNGKGTQLTAADGLPAGNSCSFAKDNRDRFWLAKGGQLGMIKNGRFEKVTGSGSQTAILCAASSGGVWICANLKLFKYDEGGILEEKGTLKPAHANSRPTVLYEDRSGAVWIGTFDSGLYRFDGSTFEAVPTSDRQIQNLVEDRKGDLWVGTAGGLNQVRKRVIFLEGAESGLPFDTVQTMCEESDGAICATTESGALVRRTGDTWNPVAADGTWPGGLMNCVASDPAGAVWIGARNGTIYCRQNGQLKSWKHADGIVGSTINTIFVSKSGDVWVGEGVPESVQCFHAGQWRTFQLPPETHIIRGLAEDAAGDIWVGAGRANSGKTFLRISGDKVTDETSQAMSLPGGERFLSTAFRSMFGTPDGSIWIGGGGLARIKNGHLAKITTDQGLRDNSISQIVADDHGWFWFGGDHGVSKVRQRDLDAALDGKVDRVQSVRYGTEEGLPNLQGNWGYSPGALRTRDGRLWIPMRTGLAVIDSASIREDVEPPPVRVRSLTVDNEIIALYGGVMPISQRVDPWRSEGLLHLPPGHRHIEFEFTALNNFRAPENIRFRYRLEGYDEAWSEPRPQRAAEYSRLPAGDYRFRVKACNGDGIWNDTGAAIGFSVEPFIFELWWVRLAGLMAFTALMFGIVRLVSVRRVRARVIAEHAALEKSRMAGMAEVATSVLHNVGNVLNSVNVSSSVIRDKARNSKIPSLVKAAAFVKEHAAEPGFLSSDPKGKQVPDYLVSLATHLETEQKDMIGEVNALEENIGHIKQIVVRQQSYARAAGTMESFSPVEVAEDALRINASTIGHGQIQIVREFGEVPTVTTDKHKILQILINLISNSKHALRSANSAPDKRLVVRVEKNGDDRIRITVKDNGGGISAENQARIFQYGFTTRKDGHGFGLHSSVMAARELGGSLDFASEGTGKGATFTLEIPAKPSQNGK